MKKNYNYNYYGPVVRFRKKKGRSFNKKLLIIPFAGIILGAAILIYPMISDLATQASTAGYVSQMTSAYCKYDEDDPSMAEMFSQAEKYNQRLAGTFEGDASEVWSYESQLAMEGEEEMSLLEIPKISLSMIVYHGTSDDVLSAGVGHVKESSLPIGGESTHTVLTAHSGLATMRGFDLIRALEEGDEIILTTCGRELHYAVTYSETVLPEETETLDVKRGEDLLTLVTCTPYGVNDHRLFVHAERVVEK